MDTSRDKVRLTSEERRVLALLESQAARDDPKSDQSLTAVSPGDRLRSSRSVGIAAVLLLLVGAGVMIGSFARWPIVGVAALGLQAIALWVMINRWAQPAGTALRLGTQPERQHKGDHR